MRKRFSLVSSTGICCAFDNNPEVLMPVHMSFSMLPFVNLGNSCTAAFHMEIPNSTPLPDAPKGICQFGGNSPCLLSSESQTGEVVSVIYKPLYTKNAHELDLRYKSHLIPKKHGDVKSQTQANIKLHALNNRMNRHPSVHI